MGNKSETTKVRIIKCKQPTFWYAKKLGKIFDVRPQNFEIKDGVPVVFSTYYTCIPYYVVLNKNGNDTNKLLPYDSVVNYDRMIKILRLKRRINAKKY